jgi:hypothetical protein
MPLAEVAKKLAARQPRQCHVPDAAGTFVLSK